MRNQDFQPTILNIARLRLRYWKKRIRHQCKKKKVKLMIYDRVDPLTRGMYHQSQFLLSQKHEHETIELDYVKIQTLTKSKAWPSAMISSYIIFKDMDENIDEQVKCHVINMGFQEIIKSINSAILPEHRDIMDDSEEEQIEHH